MLGARGCLLRVPRALEMHGAGLREGLSVGKQSRRLLFSSCLLPGRGEEGYLGLSVWAFELRLPLLTTLAAPQPPLLWNPLWLLWPAPSGLHFPLSIQGLFGWLQPYGHHCTPMFSISLLSFPLKPLLFSSPGGHPLSYSVLKVQDTSLFLQNTLAHTAASCLEIQSTRTVSPIYELFSTPYISKCFIHSINTKEAEIVTSPQPL